jgi:acetyltransferase-like isoleucine patch superfamily enzyme
MGFHFPVDKPKIEIGNYNSINNPTVYAWKRKRNRKTPCILRIANYCSIANGATFLCGGEHPKFSLSSSTLIHDIAGQINHKGNIIIGNDVWIGFGAIILSGVKIGNGAMIGAGAVISKDVPPFAVVVGNPCKVIRYRFTQNIINQIEWLGWWNYPPDDVNGILRRCQTIEEFISEFSASKGTKIA